MTYKEKLALLQDIINGEIIHPEVRKEVGKWAIKKLEYREPIWEALDNAYRRGYEAGSKHKEEEDGIHSEGEA